MKTLNCGCTITNYGHKVGYCLMHVPRDNNSVEIYAGSA